jgi:hypothetical protein
MSELAIMCQLRLTRNSLGFLAVKYRRLKSTSQIADTRWSAVADFDRIGRLCGLLSAEVRIYKSCFTLFPNSSASNCGPFSEVWCIKKSGAGGRSPFHRALGPYSM